MTLIVGGSIKEADKKFQVFISQEDFRRLAILKAQSGRSFRDMANIALKLYIEREEKKFKER